MSSSFTVGKSIHLVFALGWSDFIMRYHGTVLGFLWVFIKPLLKFLVLYAVFGAWIGSEVPYYPLYLFLGLIVWEFFTMTTIGCMTTLFQKRNVVQKMRFPLLLLPLAVGWTNLIVFGAHLLIVLLFIVVFGIALHMRMALFPIAVLCMTTFSLGIGMLLSAYCLRFRDIHHAWNVLLQLLFWLTPIFYRPSFVHGTVGRLIEMQPIALFLRDMRSMLIYTEQLPTFSPGSLLGMALLCSGILAVGVGVFQARSGVFAEQY